jgi:hypothetical protein
MNEAIFTKIQNGVVNIYNSKGFYIGHLPNNHWVSAQVNGDRIVATSKDQRCEIYDRHGNYCGHM